jgi:hypothetical protein
MQQEHTGSRKILDVVGNQTKVLFADSKPLTVGSIFGNAIRPRKNHTGTGRKDCSPSSTTPTPSPQKEDETPPEGNELKAPFGELVVPGRRQMAARTDRGGSLARPHHDLDTLLVWTEAVVLVDKSLEAVAAVENRDQFHGVEASGGRNLYHKPRHTQLAFTPSMPLWLFDGQSSVISTSMAYEWRVIAPAPADLRMSCVTASKTSTAVWCSVCDVACIRNRKSLPR